MLSSIVLWGTLFVAALAQECTTDEFLLARSGTTFMRVNTTSFYACKDQDICAQLANGIQLLSLSGATLSIGNGNSVTLPDASNTNEIQTLSVGTNSILISGGNSITADLSVTNELQSLSLSGANIQLLNPGGAVQSTVALPDSSATNEMQTLAVSGSNLQLKDASGTVYSFVALPDASTTNELQSLSLSGATIQLLNPGGAVQSSVTLPDSSASNEFQTLSKPEPNLLSVGPSGNSVVSPTPIAVFSLGSNAGYGSGCGSNGGSCASCSTGTIYSGDGVVYSCTNAAGVKAAYNSDAGAGYW